MADHNKKHGSNRGSDDSTLQLPIAEMQERVPASAARSGGVPAGIEKIAEDGKVELTEDDCYDDLGFSFSKAKKWYILTVVFWVQVSMNFNTSLYANAVPGIAEEFGVSEQGARCGASKSTQPGLTYLTTRTNNISDIPRHVCVRLRALGSVVRRIRSLAYPPALFVLRQYFSAPRRLGTEFCEHHGRTCSRRPLYCRGICDSWTDRRYVDVREPAICRGLCCVFVRRRFCPRPNCRRVYRAVPGLALVYLGPTNPWRCSSGTFSLTIA